MDDPFFGNSLKYEHIKDGEIFTEGKFHESMFGTFVDLHNQNAAVSLSLKIFT